MKLDIYFIRTLPNKRLSFSVVCKKVDFEGDVIFFLKLSQVIQLKRSYILYLTQAETAFLVTDENLSGSSTLGHPVCKHAIAL